MRISTKTRYGLRAMAYLTKKKNYTPVKEIAADEKIPYDYLEKILARLKAARLVEVKLGTQGGYRLAKTPAKITAGQIMRAMEGTLAPVICVVREKDMVTICEKSSYCIAKKIWLIVQSSLVKTLDSITLKKLVN
jgi:Rrf2 family protein